MSGTDGVLYPMPPTQPHSKLSRPVAKRALRRSSGSPADGHHAGAGGLPRRTGPWVVACLLLIAAALPTASGRPKVFAEQATVLFGSSAGQRGDETPRQAVEHLEDGIRRSLAAVRVFKRWDDAFPTSHDRWLQASGHALFLSVAAQRNDGTRIPWDTIADAAPGSSLYREVVDWADRIKAFGTTIYFIFDAEPETASLKVMGTPADFAAAWRRIVSVFRDNGVSNARFAWTLTAYTFARTDGLNAAAWYPGDQYVDAIGADGYNFFGCRPGVATEWRPFAEIFEPVRTFGRAHPSEPLVIPEWGSVEDSAVPGRKAQWIADARATLQSSGWEQFKAVLYWHSQSPTKPPCRFWVDTSDSALAAFTAMGADPHFSAVGPPGISSFSPARGAAGTSVSIAGSNFVGVLTVAFNRTATTFSVESPSHLTAVVPRRARAGSINITTRSFFGTSPAVFSVVHKRDVSLTLHTPHRRLVARGTATSEDGFAGCVTGALVKIQQKAPDKGWHTRARTLTQTDGSYRTRLAGRRGRYRALLPRVTLASADVCQRASSAVRPRRI